MDISLVSPVVLADDFNRLSKWYRETLELKVEELGSEGYRYSEFSSNGRVLFGMADAKEMGLTPPNPRLNTVILQFSVPNIKAFFDHITSHNGLILFGPTYEEKFKFWYGGFADIEGNPVWIVENEK